MKNIASLLGYLKPYSAGAAALALPAIATGLIIPTAQPAAANSPEGLQDSFQDSPKMVLDEAWQLVYQEYVDADFNRVDWLGVRQTLLSGEYTTRDAAYSELRKVLRRLEDPYTRFLNPAQYAALTEQTSGEVSGVGIRFEEQAQGLVVTSVLNGSPAKAAGVKVGDVILMLDGRSSRNLNLETASQLIRGESGSRLTLTVRRKDNSEESLILTRAVVSVPTVTAELQQQMAPLSATFASTNLAPMRPNK